VDEKEIVGRRGEAGWDTYAPFYDWENARTIGRRDVGYWTRFITGTRGRVLELGCGTGRLAMPLSRVTRAFTGIDLSGEMLGRAIRRARRRPPSARPRLLRGDIRHLPFADASIACVFGAYGVVQSLTTDRDLDETFAEVARVLAPGGRFGIDLVPDLPAWQSYQRQTRFRGTLRGRPLSLIESVRQDRRRGLTMFDEEFIVGRGPTAARHTFTLTFRTLPMDQLLPRLEAAGLSIAAVSGSYRGGAWRPDSDVWLVTATKSQKRPRESFSGKKET
jgi:SAM-dependent methyltransferase